MGLNQVVLKIHTLGTGAARRSGLLGPLRKYLGPVIGKYLFKAASGTKNPIPVDGHQMFLASEGRYPPLRMAAGTYEEATTRLLKEILRPGMVFMDVGAHVGYFSLLAAREVGPGGKVFSFEPDPSNYDLLVKNAELNGYEGLKAFNLAVSKTIGEATLFLSGLDNGRNSTYEQDIPLSGSIPIKTTTVDAFLGEQGRLDADVIKIDVEGAEGDVLEGMSGFLEQRPSVHIIIEFNPPLLELAGVDLLQFLSKPKDWGFQTAVIDDENGPVPLNTSEFRALIAKLTSDGGSVNLYWSKE